MKERAAAAPMQFDGPDRIGPYQLLAKLAEGGMGAVYLARMTGPGGFTKLAVVKQLKEDLLDERRFADLFLDEARLAARLTHSNVVHTYGAGEQDGHLYLAMEYLDGQPWSRIQRRLKKNGSLPRSAQLKVLVDTLTGLHYAHELKGFDGRPLDVVHCDISPQNVFVTYDGQVKVVDFGVARATQNKRDTGDSIFLGKVGYCAPEQARGEPVDRRADVFAVGVMLFEALTDRRFAQGEGAVKTLRSRAAGQEPRIRQVAPEVPAELADICDRATALSPADRYATAEEFRADLVLYMTRSGQVFEAGQLGGLVSDAFQGEAKRIHQLIEHHMQERTVSQRRVLDVSPGGDAGKNDNTLEADLSLLASGTRLADDDDNASTVVSASLAGVVVGTEPSELVPAVGQTRRIPLWVSVSLLGLSAVAFAFTWFGEQLGLPGLLGRQSPIEVEVDVQAQEEVPAVVPSTVSVSFSATPEGAQLFLDGNRLEGNPFSASIDPDHGLHTLRATADGYQEESRSLVLDRDVRVVMALKPVPSGPQGDRADGQGDSRRSKRRRLRSARRGRERGASQKITEATGNMEGTAGQVVPASPEPAGPTPAPGSPGAASRGSDMTIFDEDPY